MGSNTSKPNAEKILQSPRNELIRDEETDPRSPTPEISRTPLHGKGGGNHNITKNVDLRKTFENVNGEEKLIHNNPILSAVIKNHFHSYDPRSPSVDFERTPIIITSKDNSDFDKEQLKHKQIDKDCASPILRNDIENSFDSCNEAITQNLDLIVPKNLCEGFFDLSMNDTIKESDEPLGSSTASNDAIEKNMSSVNVVTDKPTRLLETAFEYVENETSAEIETVVQNSEDSVTSLDNLPLFEILDDDPRSPSIGIERTPIVVSKTGTDVNVRSVEEMSDDSLIKVLQSTNAELRQTKSQNKSPDGLLIYEDESTSSDTPKKSKSNSNGSRTPLSCMKNKTDTGHARSKSANTLYDPKNQNVTNKLSKRASHIPRLKSLTKQTKLTGSTISLKNISRASAISGDCENTPPHSHRDIWDKDNSIVL